MYILYNWEIVLDLVVGDLAQRHKYCLANARWWVQSRSPHLQKKVLDFTIYSSIWLEVSVYWWICYISIVKYMSTWNNSKIFITYWRHPFHFPEDDWWCASLLWIFIVIILHYFYCTQFYGTNNACNSFMTLVNHWFWLVFFLLDFNYV